LLYNQSLRWFPSNGNPQYLQWEEKRPGNQRFIIIIFPHSHYKKRIFSIQICSLLKKDDPFRRKCLSLKGILRKWDSGFICQGRTVRKKYGT
jgi:hypothetical protein